MSGRAEGGQFIFKKPFAQGARLGYCHRPFVNLTKIKLQQKL